MIIILYLVVNLVYHFLYIRIAWLRILKKKMEKCQCVNSVKSLRIENKHLCIFQKNYF